MRKLLSVLLGVAMIALLLVGCGNSGVGATGGPVYGAEITVLAFSTQDKANYALEMISVSTGEKYSAAADPSGAEFRFKDITENSVTIEILSPELPPEESVFEFKTSKIIKIPYGDTSTTYDFSIENIHTLGVE